jgi:hypothetical protein
MRGGRVSAAEGGENESRAHKQGARRRRREVNGIRTKHHAPDPQSEPELSLPSLAPSCSSVVGASVPPTKLMPPGTALCPPRPGLR